jgi:hypothetical protein
VLRLKARLGARRADIYNPDGHPGQGSQRHSGSQNLPSTLLAVNRKHFRHTPGEHGAESQSGGTVPYHPEAHSGELAEKKAEEVWWEAAIRSESAVSQHGCIGEPAQ